MIKIENLSFSFPNKDLYENVNFTIENGQCCAFIGSSGCGKSTLADMIMDTERYVYDGKIEIEDCNIGFVSQFYDVNEHLSVFDYIAKDFLELQKNIDDICTEMETATDYEKLMEDYQVALDAFDAIDGVNYESNINKKLALADLLKYKDLSVLKISGGQFKLVQVIKQMLTRPHFIIMDEPDAFLDFENLNALKNLINSHKGTMLVITHNRYLLNHCFNKIIHLEGKQIQEFDGNFINYNYELLESKIETKELAFADKVEIERNEVLIDRLRETATFVDSSAHGRALKARVKVQERLVNRQIKDPFINIKVPNINLKARDVLEDEVVVKVENFDISFKDVLLENVNFEVKSTDKVAIIGENGTGKTTLLKAIVENKNPAITIADDVKFSYLSQVQKEAFGDSETIYDAFFDVGFKSYTDIEEYLEGFDFPKDKLDKPISLLSGGEKNILSLAKTAFEKSNLLILDEPTSHLDIYAQIALENSLKEYNGGIIMVSHDFYTISNVVDYLFIIRDKTIHKMTLRKFRKNIYARHFNKNYLELEQDKKLIESKIERALSRDNFDLSKESLGNLKEIIAKMEEI